MNLIWPFLKFWMHNCSAFQYLQQNMLFSNKGINCKQNNLKREPTTKCSASNKYKHVKHGTLCMSNYSESEPQRTTNQGRKQIPRFLKQHVVTSCCDWLHILPLRLAHYVQYVLSGKLLSTVFLTLRPKPTSRANTRHLSIIFSLFI